MDDIAKYKFYISLILIALFSKLAYSQHSTNFKHIVPQYENKNVFISKTAQDSFGIIWMMHENGVLKYNGYSYQLVGINEIFPNLKKGDILVDLKSDENKNIWLKSNLGLLVKYNTKDGKFEDYSSKIKEPIDVFKSNSEAIWAISNKGNLVLYKNNALQILATIPNIDGINTKTTSIEFVNNNEIYLSTSKGKIYCYSLKTKTLKELVGPYTDFPTRVSLKIDSNNKLWIGTETFGLLVYDITEEEFIQDNFFKKHKPEIAKALFLNLFLDSKGNIWGGTDGDGLFKVNCKTGMTKIFKMDNTNDHSLNSNTIIDLNEDNHHNIWAVTKYGNLNIVPELKANIKYHNGSANNVPVRILSIFKGKNNNLWVGTDGNGVTRISNKNRTEQFLNSANNGFYVQSITQDSTYNIWLGTYKNGLWYYNARLNKFEKIPVTNKKKQKASDVRTVFTDSKGRVWVGSNISINIYTANRELIGSFLYLEKKLKGTILESIFEDSESTIWLGIVGGGLFKFNENLNDIEASTFQNFINEFSDSKLRIISMDKASDNEIYLIYGSGKLFRFNTKENTFTDFKHLDILQSLRLKSVVSTDPYNIWLSSSNGIHHYNEKTNLLKSYYISDGFQSNDFVPRSAFFDRKNKIYFGTNEGLNFFNPKNITKTKANPILSINEIQVLNKPVRDILNDHVSNDVYTLEYLSLKHNQSSFSIRFSATDNILNPNFQYKYKLHGFDNEWITTYNEGIAKYTNIPYGDYIFEIKANNLNEDSAITQKAISINISPPLWNLPIAYVIYFVLLGIILFGIYRWFILRKKLFIIKISRRKENQLYDAKMSFFAKMSHEIQTPLTLILGPLDDMKLRAKQNGNLLLKERLNIIELNTKRLSRIAKELTLVRNRELNKLKLFVSQNNIYKHVGNIALSFKELARKRNIDFFVNCPQNLNKIWYDVDKVEHILYNLLSNAFKHTPREGVIQLNIKYLKTKDLIKISVTDSGQGIEINELENIFKMFYRPSSSIHIKGMGIGLALTKELVTLHKGKIKVDSTQGEGTTFVIKLPISEHNYLDEEKLVSGEKFELNAINQDNNIEIKKIRNFDNTKKTVLIVEDNFELQHFLKELLQNHFIILLADNGQEGFYYAKNNIPDLIISDIMMPEMDGIEMCRELNKNSLTKHIPVILLTAKNSNKAKIEGLKTGAIEYINKPFNTNELILKIDNIITSKENIISKYRKELINKPEIEINMSQDEFFLENLVNAVNNRLSDSSFKVDELSKILNMSYSSLYRKCSALTGMNLIDFVRKLRFEKAVILLVKYGYNISEVAYMVGFNDPKYFTKSFKSQFNITPKSFKAAYMAHDNKKEFLNSYSLNVFEFENS